MDKKYEQYLFNKYPKLFSEPLRWGIECDDGWFWSINLLCMYIQKYLDNNEEFYSKGYVKEQIPQVKVVQIKEKFGSLRFYIRGGNDHTKHVISFVEGMSHFICEKTGVSDITTVGMTISSSGLYKTLQKHDKELNGTFESPYDDELISLIQKMKYGPPEKES